MITAYIDFKCPASYLAFEPTLTMEKEVGLDVTWQPFPVVFDPVPTRKADESKGETHRRIRAEHRRAIHQKYAKLRNLEMDFGRAEGVTDLALSALLCDLPHSDAYIAAAFKAYWAEGQDLNDKDVVMTLLSQTGNPLSEELLQSRADDLSAFTEQLFEQGLFATPTFICVEQRFIGREHLPLIKAVVLSARA